MRQTPLTCSGHTRPVVDLAFSRITPYGYFLISACKGKTNGQSAGLVGFTEKWKVFTFNVSGTLEDVDPGWWLDSSRCIMSSLSNTVGPLIPLCLLASCVH